MGVSFGEGKGGKEDKKSNIRKALNHFLKGQKGHSNRLNSV